MASENETVASVADCIRHLADTLPNGVILNIAQCNFTADRIDAAHKREVAELRECLKEAVFVMQTLFDKQMPKWRKALEGAGHEG